MASPKPNCLASHPGLFAALSHVAMNGQAEVVEASGGEEQVR